MVVERAIRAVRTDTRVVRILGGPAVVDLVDWCVFPPGLVDEVIAGCERAEQRHRSWPARVMAYFSTGMALHSEGAL
jgi:hypothetical protein